MIERNSLSLLGLTLRELTDPNPLARSDYKVLAPRQPGIIINKPICQSGPHKVEQNKKLH